jgi:hypothetical protein
MGSSHTHRRAFARHYAWRTSVSACGVPVLLKKRNLIELNDISTYLDQLKSRVTEHTSRKKG